MARFSYLILREGVWKGERLLPQSYMELSKLPVQAVNYRITTSGYLSKLGLLTQRAFWSDEAVLGLMKLYVLMGS